MHLRAAQKKEGFHTPRYLESPITYVLPGAKRTQQGNTLGVKGQGQQYLAD